MNNKTDQLNFSMRHVRGCFSHVRKAFNAAFFQQGLKANIHI